MMTDPMNLTGDPIVEPHERMQIDTYLTSDEKTRFEACIDAMNAIFLGTDLSKQETDSSLSNEFDKFTSLSGESIESIYQRFSRLMNEMQRNEVLPKHIAINTKFFNSLKIEWSKYVIMVRQAQNLHTIDYDLLFDYLKQNEGNTNASRAKRAARSHDPLTLVANSYASPSSSRKLHAYYVTHPPSVNDFDGDTQSYNYQGDANSDDPTNNLITINVGNFGNAGRNTWRSAGSSRNTTYAQRTNGNISNVQRMLLENKYESGINLDEEENDFFLAYATEEEEFEELNASCIMMDRIQTVNNDYDIKPSYDYDFVNKFMGIVRFENDNFVAIMGYGDYVHGNITICHVYYVDGLGHNLFFVGQLCDRDLEVAFRLKTCYVRNLEGDDLLTGARDSNLYTISISEMSASSSFSNVQSLLNKVLVMALSFISFKLHYHLLARETRHGRWSFKIQV
ncbi:hypothetical protein Tco_0972817 [Tanacetum coccineum]